ncbi:Uncharacterized 39.9 kDa protein in amylase 3'region [Candidatus Protochlamydia naegleriophila]|uniref:Uncharacterized 39.9 kDa protein in amylase 3'region n=1 Tax=Candidatus Protochlamydia naegleriophila TaxID=389348 RepID=A0A0U5JCK2_9BACT|nr:acyltransferase [Candidatus Protochlamydia naegleriophila]CUI16111.1 Uncharacterized 39.9 kDa protein in amylase 3'region [Candidatus Protochlamydia naegleriophila]
MAPANPQERFHFLDALRGIAALAIVILHNYQMLNAKTGFTYPDWLHKLIFSGHSGVTIFFIISGFVIAYSVRKSFISFHYCKLFFIKRSIRLDPPYWITLFVMISSSLLFAKLVAKQDESVFQNAEIISNIFYLQGFFDHSSINPVSWTLCMELQLYLFFVLMLATIFRISLIASYQQQIQLIASRAFPLFFAFLLFLSLEQNLNLIFPYSAIYPYNPFALHYWYLFFLGVATCWEKIGWIQRTWLYSYYAIVFVYILASLQKEMAAGLSIAAMIHLLGRHDYLTTWRGHPVFQYLGKISYSLYLIHWLASSNFINFVSKRAGDIYPAKATLILAGGILVAIGAAHVFYEWIEHPCLKWSQRLSIPQERLHQTAIQSRYAK